MGLHLVVRTIDDTKVLGTLQNSLRGWDGGAVDDCQEHTHIWAKLIGGIFSHTIRNTSKLIRKIIFFSKYFIKTLTNVSIYYTFTM